MYALYRSRLTRPLLWYLCVALGVIAGVPGEVLASLVPLGDAVRPDPAARLTDLARIQTVLELKLVRQRLLELGLTEQEVSARLAWLSDEEVHEVAQRLDEVGAGGQGLQCAGQGQAALYCAGLIPAVFLLAGLVALIVFGITRLAAWLRHVAARPAPSDAGRAPCPQPDAC